MSPCWHEGGLPRPLQLSKGSRHANSGGSQRQRDCALQAKTNGGVKIAFLRANEERAIQVRLSEHSAAIPRGHHVSPLA